MCAVLGLGPERHDRLSDELAERLERCAGEVGGVTHQEQVRQAIAAQLANGVLRLRQRFLVCGEGTPACRASVRKYPSRHQPTTTTALPLPQCA
jgi:hypothetical protein